MVGLLGFATRVAIAHVDEESFLLSEPAASAINVAAAKAKAIHIDENEVLLAADTLVVDDGEVLGKPADSESATEMLMRLRGRPHHVVTGVVLKRESLEWAGAVDTLVLMRAYTEQEIEAYIARGEPFDKAGGYAVQDAAFRPTERLEGCYLNVVGLPLCAVAAGMTAVGIDVERAGPPPCVYCERGKELVRSG